MFNALSKLSSLDDKNKLSERIMYCTCNCYCCCFLLFFLTTKVKDSCASFACCLNKITTKYIPGKLNMILVDGNKVYIIHFFVAVNLHFFKCRFTATKLA